MGGIILLGSYWPGGGAAGAPPERLQQGGSSLPIAPEHAEPSVVVPRVSGWEPPPHAELKRAGNLKAQPVHRTIMLVQYGSGELPLIHIQLDDTSFPTHALGPRWTLVERRLVPYGFLFGGGGGPFLLRPLPPLLRQAALGLAPPSQARGAAGNIGIWVMVV